MEKEFVNYELALALKELGFNEPCFTYYYDINKILRKNIVVDIDNGWTYFPNRKLITLAPTFSQAFRFFRDKKLSDSCVCRYQSRDDGGIYYYYYVINHDFGIEETKHFKEGFFSYEEAELACLLKMIEIVKNK